MRRIVIAVLFLALAAPLAGWSHFVYITNNDDTLTIIADPGASGSLEIPSEINGLTVSGILELAFSSTTLSNLTIPAGVEQIGAGIVAGCPNLTNISVAAGNPVFGSTNGILFDTFDSMLLEAPPTFSGSYIVPDGITALQAWSFAFAGGLYAVTNPASVAAIGDFAFINCTNLGFVWFEGNAPAVGQSVFSGDTNTTIYYLPGTSGWKATFAGRPTQMYNPPGQGGALRVTILPVAAARSGAQWQVDGGPAQPSGATVLGLTVGSHTLSFSDGKNWAAPSNETVSITAGGTNTASGTYAQLGSLEVTLTPVNAVVAGATWQVDGGAAQASGAFADALSAGSHVVSFNAPPGWSAPASQTITVRAGITARANGAFKFAAAGVYNGLFYAGSGVMEETAGMMKSLTVTPAGTYSGRLLLDGENIALTGSFDGGGNSVNVIHVPQKLGGTLDIQMMINSSNSPADITGGVDVGAGAFLTNYPAGTNKASSEETILLTSNDEPPGYGYLLVTNHAGNVTLSGALPDGTAINQSIVLAANGMLPVYASLYNSTGLLLGWLDLSSNTVSGNLTWIKKASRAALYPAGFTNVLSASGSVWVAPPAKTAAFVLTNGNLEISGGYLAARLNFNVELGNNNVLVKLGDATNSLSGTVNPKTGSLTVTFGNGAGRATTVGHGAVLQNSSSAGGFFVGKTNAGSILLGTP